MCIGYDCAQTSCQESLMPYGQCCPICGAMITLDYGNTYTESAMKQFLLSTSSKVRICISLFESLVFIYLIKRNKLRKIF